MDTNPGSLFDGFKPKGWVLLAESMPSIGAAFPDLADRLLERIDLSRPPLAIAAGSARSREMPGFMKELDELIGGESIILELAEAATHQIEDAGLIALAGGNPQEWFLAFTHDDLDQRLIGFLQAGGLVLAAGAPASILGSWVLEEGASHMSEGVGWLPESIVLPGISDPAALPHVMELLGSGGRRLALGLPQESALAVGPGGNAEVWSLIAPKIVLGRGWRE